MVSTSGLFGRDSSATSRIKTGDTGYDSLSSLSYSSLTSNSHLKISDSNYNLNSLNTNKSTLLSPLHQPKIASNSLSSSNSIGSNPALSNLIKPVTQTSMGSLKQLKTNLAPLSGIKLPK